MELWQLLLVGLVGGLGSAVFTALWKSLAAAVRWRFDRGELKATSDAELARDELIPAFRRARTVPRIDAGFDDRRAYEAILDEIDDTLLRLHGAAARARLEQLVEVLRQHDLIWRLLPARYALGWVVSREARNVLGALARRDPVPPPQTTVTRVLIPALEAVEEYIDEQARAQDELEELYRKDQYRKRREANARAARTRAAASALAEDDGLAVEVAS